VQATLHRPLPRLVPTLVVVVVWYRALKHHGLWIHVPLLLLLLHQGCTMIALVIDLAICWMCHHRRLDRSKQCLLQHRHGDLNPPLHRCRSRERSKCST